MTMLDPPPGGKTVCWHLAEFLSWLSCGLNVLTGGEREMTFSAGSWHLKMKGAKLGHARVFLVDNLSRLWGDGPGHCEEAYAYLEAVLRKRQAARCREVRARIRLHMRRIN